MSTSVQCTSPDFYHENTRLTCVHIMQQSTKGLQVSHRPQIVVISGDCYTFQETASEKLLCILEPLKHYHFWGCHCNIKRLTVPLQYFFTADVSHFANEVACSSLNLLAIWPWVYLFHFYSRLGNSSPLPRWCWGVYHGHLPWAESSCDGQLHTYNSTHVKYWHSVASGPFQTTVW